MKIILLEDHRPEVRAAERLLRDQGHEVLHTDCTSLAQAYARINPPDLLIAALFPNGTGAIGENGLSVAMAVQFQNPEAVTILLSDSAVFAHGELFAMLTSLRCILPRQFTVGDLVETALYFLDQGGEEGAPDSVAPDGATVLYGIKRLTWEAERQVEPHHLTPSRGALMRACC